MRTEPHLRQEIEHAVSKLKAAQWREQPWRLVEITRENGKQPIANVEKVDRRHEYVTEQRRIDSVDQPGEGVEATLGFAVVGTHQPLAASFVTEPGIDRFRREGGATHRHHDAARKQRIDEGKCVADEEGAVSGDAL